MRFLVAAIAVLMTGCSNVERCGIDLSASLAKHHGQTISLHRFTRFEWDEVRLYGEYTPSSTVRDETGLTYHPALFMPQDSHVPEHHSFVAFLHKGEGVCGEHYNHSAACLDPKWDDPDPLFLVSPECKRPD